MKIELINVGRNRINKTVIVKNEKAMWKEIGSHLMSRDIDIVGTNVENKYTIWAGMRPVGEVIISQ